MVILALSIGVGVALALALGAGLEASPMPYVTELAPVLTGAALLFVFGLIGATVAAFRVTRTGQLTALGGEPVTDTQPALVLDHVSISFGDGDSTSTSTPSTTFP
ncbi:hypothetical protein CJ204_00370 [Corynebacterium xerosis]|uniref:Uncharacterized protein n=1 Tax=Corynebacterium xerosis TaxID=1725 RepID=A0A2N6T210_9CORY|nr:hypothetical protein CJ204_00370 [Corynebacterium xerosis]